MTYTILDVKCLDIKRSFKKNVLVPFHIQDRLGAGAPSQAPGCRSWAVLAGNTWDAPWPISTKDPFSVGTTNQETPLIFPKGMNRLHEALHCPSPGALTDCHMDTLSKMTQTKHRVTSVQTSQVGSQHFAEQIGSNLPVSA